MKYTKSSYTSSYCLINLINWYKINTHFQFPDSLKLSLITTEQRWKGKKSFSVKKILRIYLFLRKFKYSMSINSNLHWIKLSGSKLEQKIISSENSYLFYFILSHHIYMCNPCTFHLNSSISRIISKQEERVGEQYWPSW